MYPPRIGKVKASLSDFQYTPHQDWKSWSKFKQLPMYPPGMEKLKSQVNVTFWFWLMYPPPRNEKVEISGQCDILVLADVPPLQGMEKLKSQVSVTFWFWLMYPPPPQECKSWNLRSVWHFGSGWCTPLPRNWNWTKHECYRTNHFKRGHQVHFTIYPPPPFQYHYLILCLNRKLVNFNLK